MEEQFLAGRNSRGKEPIDLQEGSDDSDDSARELDDPIVSGSGRRVRKRGLNTNSQMQELIDLYRESMTKKDKAKISTPPESKKSNSSTLTEDTMTTYGNSARYDDDSSGDDDYNPLDLVVLLSIQAAASEQHGNGWNTCSCYHASFGERCVSRSKR
ncbi:hypothetical protein CRG98_005904 [Punica granatum]|uniref:Uncharacterized protein n=1 Tax=Punica granatum TaxID=22663 RepID=A0A2I0KZ87_PUNGR|nr:hypothetical protein CRG98_005904 [Punica granatum]